MEFEIAFAEEFLALVNKYVQSKSIDILDKRYEILRGEIDNLAREIREQEKDRTSSTGMETIKLDTQIELDELSPDTSSQIMMELNDIDELPVEVRVVLK